MKMILVSAIFVVLIGNEAIADHLTTTQIGNFTYTTGTVNGQQVSTTTSRIGNFSYTNGQVGDEQVNTTSSQIGSFTHTNGQMGDQQVNLTSSRIGNFTHTNGQIGDQQVNLTSSQIGNFTHTNGQIGDGVYNSTTSQMGDMSHTSATYSQPPRTSTISVYGTASAQAARKQPNIRACNLQADEASTECTDQQELSVASIFLSRQRISLSDGAEYSFRYYDRDAVRSWHNGDPVTIKRGKQGRIYIENATKGRAILVKEE